ncbi:MAG: tetratricopeptide repeat protein [Pelagimonas sp.]|uniref:tetratricopeptide repeat protein n=1 Tax=Pelagimonas sp. TaxID=2073170 RepID=UPI003D6C6F13
MQAFPIVRAGILGLAYLFVASCDDIGVGQNNFQAKYAIARNALENGNYDVAKRYYAKLVAEAGPLSQRLQLEYAHAELRSGNYDQAAAISSTLANSQTGNARAAALAVFGTAQHEQGLELLSTGQKGAGKTHMISARKALSEVIKTNPEMDPLGSLEGRVASISARLKTL